MPTYNRFEKISAQLGCLLSQCCGIDQVEILVSDNHSDDGTSDLLMRLEDEYPSLRVFIQKENRGPINNMVFLVDQAQADYLWMLGDDDVVKQGVVDDILGVINKHKDLSLVYLNYNEEMEGEGYFSELAGLYPDGMDLFNRVSESRGAYGAMMFSSASIHRTENARKFVEIFQETGEFDNDNMAFPLGLSFYSAMCGSGFVIGKTYLYDDVTGICWKKDAYRVRYRDMLAVLDKTMIHCGKTADELGMDLIGYTGKSPEWFYLLSGCSCDNYAMRYRLHHDPKLLLPDLAYFLAFWGRGIWERANSFTKRGTEK